MEEYVFKIIIVGDPAVGKTALLLRYVEDRFEEEYLSTIGVDFYLKNIVTENTEIKFQIWDTGGQEKFANIRPGYYVGSCGAIIVYDVTNRGSFENLVKWIKEVKEFCPNIPLIMTGNKVDLPRVVSVDEAKKFAASYNIPIFETSAKDNINVDDLFNYFSLILLKQGITPSSPEITKTLSFEELSQNYTQCSNYATKYINERDYLRALGALEKVFIYSKAINFQSGMNWAREQTTFISKQLTEPALNYQDTSTRLRSPDFMKDKPSIRQDMKKLLSEFGTDWNSGIKFKELRPKLKKPEIIPGKLKEKPPIIVPAEIFDILNSIRDKIVFGETLDNLVHTLRKSKEAIFTLYKNHPILFEMEKIINTLSSFRQIRTVDNVIRNLLLEKIHDWENKIQIS
ncbi:MAG: Rab family GTPase [Candidatus Helarchaeota archaeon]